MHPRQILNQEDLFAKKKFGQNFLLNSQIADMIVKKAQISNRDYVMEIGAGLGALTIAIAKKALHVTAIEKDEQIAFVLQKIIKEKKIKNVTIIKKDFLKLDIKKIMKAKKCIAMGNLPYNISSQVLFKLIIEKDNIKRAVLMFQKELAQRILSLPREKNYSRLSAVVQYAANINCVGNLKPSCFFPEPSVNSSLLKFDFLKQEKDDSNKEKLLFNVIKACFSKRRKTLNNSLVSCEFGFDKSFVEDVLEIAGINKKRRAQTLTIQEFKSLTSAIYEKKRL